MQNLANSQTEANTKRKTYCAALALNLAFTDLVAIPQSKQD